MVKMNLLLSNVQASTTASHCQSQLAAYQAIQTAINDFVADTENLKGKAYTSARSYYSSVLLPIAQGAELYVETARSSMHNLPSECTAKCGASPLDSEVIEEMIRAQESSISSLELQYDGLKHSSVPMAAKQSNLDSMSHLIGVHQGIKKELEEQLQKLLEFDAYSPQIFSEADALKADLEKGLQQTENSWDATSQTFIIPSDLAWARHLSTLHRLKNTDYTVQEKEFFYNLQEQYGFDLETANNILDLKRGVDKEFPKLSQAEKDYILLRVIGMANYDGMKWNATAGGLGEYFHSSYPVDGTIRTFGLPEILNKLGLDEEKIPAFLYNLRLQHQLSGVNIDDTNANTLKQRNKTLYNSYKLKMEAVYGSITEERFDQLWNERLTAYNGKNDFTHQSVTMATHLYDNQFRLANLLGGHENTNKLSGWKGDVTMAAGADPSMKDDDYKADLDSVNLIHRMAKGQSYLEASRQYYQDLGAEKINRAKEFLDNLGGIDKVKDEIYSTLPDNVEYDVKTKSYKLREKSDGEAEAFIKDYPLQFGDTDRFLRALEQEVNSLNELK